MSIRIIIVLLVIGGFFFYANRRFEERDNERDQLMFNSNYQTIQDSLIKLSYFLKENRVRSYRVADHFLFVNNIKAAQLSKDDASVNKVRSSFYIDTYKARELLRIASFLKAERIYGGYYNLSLNTFLYQYYDSTGVSSLARRDIILMSKDVSRSLLLEGNRMAIDTLDRMLLTKPREQ